jgi:hypothetical protein
VRQNTAAAMPATSAKAIARTGRRDGDGMVTP